MFVAFTTNNANIMCALCFPPDNALQFVLMFVFPHRYAPQALMELD